MYSSMVPPIVLSEEYLAKEPSFAALTEVLSPEEVEVRLCKVDPNLKATFAISTLT